MPAPTRLDPHKLQDALDQLMEADEAFELPFEPGPTQRGLADAIFLVAFLGLVERYGDPDYPKRGRNLEPVDDAEGSPMAVWDLEEYELALYVRDDDTEFSVWLTRDE